MNCFFFLVSQNVPLPLDSGRMRRRSNHPNPTVRSGPPLAAVHALVARYGANLSQCLPLCDRHLDITRNMEDVCFSFCAKRVGGRPFWLKCAGGAGVAGRQCIK